MSDIKEQISELIKQRLKEKNLSYRQASCLTEGLHFTHFSRLMMQYRVDTRDLYERVWNSIREVSLKGDIVLEIQIHPEKYNLLMATCPPEMVKIETDGVVTFANIPIIRKFIDKDVEWQLKT